MRGVRQRPRGKAGRSSFPTPWPLWLTALSTIVGGFAATPRPVHACATCTAGDPTLAQMGQEAPFAGRVRLAGSIRHASYRIGRPGIDRLDVREQRLDLSASWSPWSPLTVSLNVPLVRRRVDYVHLARDETYGPGDLDLRMRLVLFRDRSFDPDHLVSLVAGTELPTTPRLRDGQGRVLPEDAHPGTSSWDPYLGVSYVHLRERWSFFGSATGQWFGEGIGGLQLGPSLRLAAQGQWQPDPRVGVQLGGLLRVDDAPRLDGRSLPEGAGAILFVSPGLVASPATDLVLSAVVRIPIVQALSGAHREGVVAELGVAVDL